MDKGMKGLLTGDLSVYLIEQMEVEFQRLDKDVLELYKKQTEQRKDDQPIEFAPITKDLISSNMPKYQVLEKPSLKRLKT